MCVSLLSAQTFVCEYVCVLYVCVLCVCVCICFVCLYV